MNKRESIVVEGATVFDHRHYTGPVVGRFLSGLQEGRILGARCGTCRRMYVPARSYCPRCFTHTDEPVEISKQGTLQTFTTVRYDQAAAPLPTPHTLGLVKLDGADTAMLHVIDPGAGSLQTGARVEAVFKANRSGSILDILHFKLVG